MRLYIHGHDVIAYTGAKLTNLDMINFVMLYTVRLSEIFHMCPMVKVIHEKKMSHQFNYSKKKVVGHMTYLDVNFTIYMYPYILIEILRVITLF